MANTRLDAAQTIAAFGLLYNRMTGLGTGRSKAEYTEINPEVRTLDEHELSGLYRKSGVIQRAVNLYPQDGKQAWCKLNFASSSVTPEEVLKYADGLGLRDALAKASLYSRWFGDGYIFMGVADGQDPQQPLNTERIKSVRWLKVYSRWEVRPMRPLSRRWEDLEYYEILQTGDDLLDKERIWHKSRVLRITGVELDRTGLWENWGANDSVIQQMYESFCNYYPALQAMSIMVQDHRLRKKGITNLAGTDKNDLVAMAVSNDLTRSVARTEFYDKELEELDNLTNTYGGLKEVAEKLEEAWASDTDISRVILFNQLGKTNLTSGEAFRFARLDHAYRLNSWQENKQRQPLTTAFELIMLAADSPTKGRMLDGWTLTFPLNYRMTPEEELGVQKLATERDEKNINLGLYDAQIARRQYTGAEYDHNITFDEGDEKRLNKVDEKKLEEKLNPPEPVAQPMPPRKDSVIPVEIVESTRAALELVEKNNVRVDAKYLEVAKAIIDGSVDFEAWRRLLNEIQVAGE